MKRTGRQRSSGGRRRSPLTAPIAAGAVALLGALWWLARPAPIDFAPGVASERHPATKPGGPPAPSFLAPPAGRDLPAPVAGPKGAPVFEPIARTRGGAAASGGPGPELLAYGGRSGRLPADRRPASAEPRAETRSPTGRPSLTVWLPSLRVTAAGTTLHARLDGGAGTLAAVNAELSLAVGAASPAPPAPMSATPDDGDGDGDGSTVELSLPYQPDPRLFTTASGNDQPGNDVRVPAPTAVRYLVRARGTLDGTAFERTAGGIFYLHRPGGQLMSGAAAAVREDGDLRVKVDAVIERPGTYFVYAELWGGAAGDRPIAFARERLPGLARGTRQISLLFGGAIVRDSGIDGPYLVRNLRFQQVDTHPAHEADPVAALPPTAPFRASEFH